MRELGYVDGTNIVIEYRFTDDDLGVATDLAAGYSREFAGLPVDVIVATSSTVVAAAKNATSSIPIVGTILGPDPVNDGLVSSLGRPGGNVTGVTAATGAGLVAKRLQILKELRPDIRRVAALGDMRTPAKQADVRALGELAQSFGMDLLLLEIRSAADIDGALRTLSIEALDGVLIFMDPITAVHSQRIVTHVNELRLPAVYEVRLWTNVGGLMNYGINSVEQFRRAASYVDKILKGANPGDLPVEQPDKLEFVVNLAVARALDLTIPPSLLAQATEILN
jgi:putative ABC transport system substrate-binding protein